MAASMSKITLHYFLIFLAIFISCAEISFSNGVQKSTNGLKQQKNTALKTLIERHLRKNDTNPKSQNPQTHTLTDTEPQLQAQEEKFDFFHPNVQFLSNKGKYIQTHQLTADRLDGEVQDEVVGMSSSTGTGNVLATSRSADDALSKISLTNMNQVSQRTMKAASIARKNLEPHFRTDNLAADKSSSHNSILYPGDSAKPFTLQTLNGTLTYPGQVINKTTSILFHAFTRDCGFVDALWNSEASLKSILMDSPENVHYIFLSSSMPLDAALADAMFMKRQLKDTASKLNTSRAKDSLSRMHFVTTPLPKLGNWILYGFYDWTCSDHNCGIDQINVTTSDFGSKVLTAPRLDARYDWLPSPVQIFGNKTTELVWAGQGCSKVGNITDNIALVGNGSCSYFEKVLNMQKSGAKGVLIMADFGSSVEDMQCLGSDCDVALTIPAAMIPYDIDILFAHSPMVQYVKKPWHNFFIGVDRSGKLAEVGWFLFPSFQFFVWQAQWFDYLYALDFNLSKPAMIVPVLDGVTMQGKTGAVASVKMPPMKDLQRFGRVELDMSLSCPGTRDETCPHWDHTVQLYVCCDDTSALCGMELGRWISPFRRRIGEWLTDVTTLIPLLAGNTCNFTMKTAPWAMPWKPSLNLRLTDLDLARKGQAPSEIVPLFTVGATFDKSYNSHWKPVTVVIPKDAKKVVLTAVITGHGSDNNGCGEFCVTSHHFTINNQTMNVTFDKAGTPLGCADQVSNGVEPNEHGTWLYGRDGWCDGREVDPIIFDLTHLAPPGDEAQIRYRGTFNGTDPNPLRSPGIIILYSYLTIYKDV